MMADLDFAFELADIADAITTDRFHVGGLITETKADMSPVTEVDRAVESAIGQHIRSHRRADSIIGEEYGGGNVGGRRWIIDPIDGTAYFINGHPGWATFIILEVNGEIAIAVGSFPTSDRRIWAARGHGSFDNGISIHVSKISRLRDARILTCDANSIAWRGHTAAILRLAGRTRRMEPYEGALAALDVARGTADALIDLGGGIWDYAPLKLIVEEAGGCFTDIRGSQRADRGSAVASNGLVHRQILNVLF